MKENTNELINDLYNKIDNLELINKEQALDLIKLRIYIKTIKRNCKRDKAKLRKKIDKAIEYIKDLLKEEFEITDENNVDYGMKCQRAYFSDSELIKVLELLGDKE